MGNSIDIRMQKGIFGAKEWPNQRQSQANVNVSKSEAIHSNRNWVAKRARGTGCGEFWISDFISCNYRMAKR